MHLQIDTERNREMVAKRARAALPTLLACEELLTHPGRYNSELDVFGAWWNFMPTSNVVTKRAASHLNGLRGLIRMAQETVSDAMKEGVIPSGEIPGVGTYPRPIVLVLTENRAKNLLKTLDVQHDDDVAEMIAEEFRNRGMKV